MNRSKKVAFMTNVENDKKCGGNFRTKCSLFLFFGEGITARCVQVFSWLSAQESFLMIFGRPYLVPRIEMGLATCKVGTLILQVLIARKS